ncbi:MAG: butyrate kinase, partial [Candidatus Hydrogenedentes bacterium]|nr:butyrate kinase [Candidatus Hydrogenedentota bacterium]
ALAAPAYVIDPVVVDEFIPEAEISGYKGITRRSISHALSVRAAARKAAESLGRRLEDISLVIAHLGGGISITAMRDGRMVDSNISFLGGGPFTPQRAGDLPAGDLIDLCYSGRYTREKLFEELTRCGGLQSYLGDYRLDRIETRIREGDAYARLVVDAMIYQIAKGIGAMVVAAGGTVEAIVLTGGMIRSERVRKGLQQHVGRLAPLILYDQPLEMEALASETLRVLEGRIRPHEYRCSNAIGGPSA